MTYKQWVIIPKLSSKLIKDLFWTIFFYTLHKTVLGWWNQQYLLSCPRCRFWVCAAARRKLRLEPLDRSGRVSWVTNWKSARPFFKIPHCPWWLGICRQNLSQRNQLILDKTFALACRWDKHKCFINVFFTPSRYQENAELGFDLEVLFVCKLSPHNLHQFKSDAF